MSSTCWPALFHSNAASAPLRTVPELVMWRGTLSRLHVLNSPSHTLLLTQSCAFRGITWLMQDYLTPGRTCGCIGVGHFKTCGLKSKRTVWMTLLDCGLSVRQVPGSRAQRSHSPAAKVDRTCFDVLWVHYVEESEQVMAVKFQRSIKSTCFITRDISSTSVAKTEAVLESMTQRPCILFFDGHKKGNAVSDTIFDCCTLWQCGDRENRRLVIVSSMVSRGKDHKPDTIEAVQPPVQKNGSLLRITMLFELPSWTLDEYLDAVQHDKFFQSVKLKLRSSNHNTRISKETSIKDKFYVAGGSARAMFAETWSGAVEKLQDAVESVTSFTDLLAGNGSRLLGLYRRGSSDVITQIVSPLAARMVAVKLGPEVVLSCAWARHVSSAHTFAEWFLASMAFTGVEYERQGSVDGTKLVWKQHAVSIIDPETSQVDTASMTSDWRIPVKWTQGGYDAVFLEPCGSKTKKTKQAAVAYRFCFVQLARAKARSFEEKPFYDLLVRLKNAELYIRSVELYYVVPQSLPAEFKPSVDIQAFCSSVVDRVFTQQQQRIDCNVHIVGVVFPDHLRRGPSV